MAIWQYKINFVPRGATQNADGTVIGAFPEYAEKSHDESELFDIDVEFPRRWDPHALAALETPLRELFGTPVPHWGGGSSFGDESGTCAIICDDSLEIRLDARHTDVKLIEAVADLGQRNDLVVVLPEGGTIIECSVEGISAAFEKSRASQYCEDPEGTLKKIGRQL